MSFQYWIGTIPATLYFIPGGPQEQSVCYFCGQQELGEGGLLHWQVVLYLREKQRRSWLSKRFQGHWEPTRSEAARDYCLKEDTRVEGTQFRYGNLPKPKRTANDWDAIRAQAQAGDLASIPADVYVRCYNSLKRIRVDHLVACRVERICYVYWGPTGTGKSRRAWNEAGDLAYPKDPCTKWWCGYSGQENVILDEFRGAIGISHLLRWLDRYPVTVETKGGAVPLVASKVWITSNLDPREWYPELDEPTRLALLRRLTIINFTI